MIKRLLTLVFFGAALIPLAAVAEAAGSGLDELRAELHAVSQQRDRLEAQLSTLETQHAELIKRLNEANAALSLSKLKRQKQDQLLASWNEQIEQSRATEAASTCPPAPVTVADSAEPGLLQQALKVLDSGELVLAQVHFSTASSDLTVGGERKLEQLAQMLHKFPPEQVRIVGFTDTVGDSAYNLDLSKRRAAAVSDMLARLGVPAAAMSLVGNGEGKGPVLTEDNTDEPLNRCVSVRVIP